MSQRRPSTKSRTRGRETKTKTADAVDCAVCVPAKCCMYFSTEIDAPDSARDFDDILWMIAHRDVEVYTKRRRWYLMVRTPCRFYEPTRGCLIYPVRPRICRQHQTTSCEYGDDYEFDRHFRSYEELERYYRKRFPAPKARARARR
jgi:uncharacterized protein